MQAQQQPGYHESGAQHHDQQYRHHNINLKQVQHQNAHSVERPYGQNSQAPGQQLSSGIALKQHNKGGATAQATQKRPGQPAHDKQFNQTTQNYTGTTTSNARSLEPPKNRNPKLKEQLKNGGGVKQLVLEDPAQSGKVVMPPISTGSKRLYADTPKTRQEQKMREQLLQRQEILAQLRQDIFGDEQKTRFGNIICNAFWGFWPTDDERYINPKMEDELVVFKKKIKQRFEGRDIPNTFSFPRFNTELHEQITQKHANQAVALDACGHPIGTQQQYIRQLKLSRDIHRKKICNLIRVVDSNLTDPIEDTQIEGTPQGQSFLPSALDRNAHADGPLEESPSEVIAISELTTEVQDLVLEHLVQVGSIQPDEANVEQVRARGQLSMQDLTEILNQQVLQQPQTSKSHQAQMNQQLLQSSNTRVPATDDKSGPSSAQGLPKIQNYVKSAQYTESTKGSAQRQKNASQQNPAQANVNQNGSSKYFRQNANLSENPSSGIENQPPQQVANQQVPLKKKLHHQPSQNKMKNVPSSQMLDTGAKVQPSQRGSRNITQMVAANTGSSIEIQSSNIDMTSAPGTVKLGANSEKKKRAAPAYAVRGKLQGQNQMYQSTQFIDTTKNFAGVPSHSGQSTQKFKLATKNVRGSSHEMSLSGLTGTGTGQMAGAIKTQNINIAEIMSPITNAAIMPSSKKQRSGGGQSSAQQFPVQTLSAARNGSQMSLGGGAKKAAAVAPIAQGRNSRSKLSKQSQYASTLAQNIHANTVQNARSASNQRAGSKTKMASQSGQATLQGNGKKPSGAGLSETRNNFSGQLKIDHNVPSAKLVNANVNQIRNKPNNLAFKNFQQCQYTSTHKQQMTTGMNFSQALNLGAMTGTSSNTGTQKIPSKKQKTSQEKPIGAYNTKSNMSSAAMVTQLNFGINSDMGQKNLMSPDWHRSQQLKNYQSAQASTLAANANVNQFSQGNQSTNYQSASNASGHQLTSQLSASQNEMLKLQNVKNKKILQSQQKQISAKINIYGGSKPGSVMQNVPQSSSVTANANGVGQSQNMSIQQTSNAAANQFIGQTMRSHTSTAANGNGSQLKQPQSNIKDIVAMQKMSQKVQLQQIGRTVGANQNKVVSMQHQVRYSSKDSNKSHRTNRSHGVNNQVQTTFTANPMHQTSQGSGQLTSSTSNFQVKQLGGIQSDMQLQQKAKRMYNSQRSRNNPNYQKMYTTQGQEPTGMLDQQPHQFQSQMTTQVILHDQQQLSSQRQQASSANRQQLKFMPPTQQSFSNLHSQSHSLMAQVPHASVVVDKIGQRQHSRSKAAGGGASSVEKHLSQQKMQTYDSSHEIVQKPRETRLVQNSSKISSGKAAKPKQFQATQQVKGLSKLIDHNFDMQEGGHARISSNIESLDIGDEGALNSQHTQSKYRKRLVQQHQNMPGAGSHQYQNSLSNISVQQQAHQQQMQYQQAQMSGMSNAQAMLHASGAGASQVMRNNGGVTGGLFNQTQRIKGVKDMNYNFQSR